MTCPPGRPPAHGRRAPEAPSPRKRCRDDRARAGFNLDDPLPSGARPPRLSPTRGKAEKRGTVAALPFVGRGRGWGRLASAWLTHLALVGRARVAGILGAARVRCGAGIGSRARVVRRAGVRCGGARVAAGLLGSARIARCRARVAACRQPCSGRKRRAGGLPCGDRIGVAMRGRRCDVVRRTCRGQSAGAHREAQGHRGCTGNQGMRPRRHHVLPSGAPAPPAAISGPEALRHRATLCRGGGAMG